MAEPAKYLRFSILYRIEHWVLTLSFALLAVTGLIQQHVDAAFPRWMVGAFGGIENVRFWHHLAAIVLMIETIYHIGSLGYRWLVLGVRPSMLPGKQDLVNAFQALRYNLGLSKKRPMQGHFTFEEKAEYWAVVWGTIVMGLTGFMLWNPIATTSLLPGDIVPAAKAAHGLEALLAVLAIILWHLYHVHLRHFNKSIFTGYVTEEELADEHPGELAAIKAGQKDPVPSRQQVSRRRRIFVPAYAVAAIVMLVGVYFFVGYEQTAIATLPPPEQVPVFSPLTPTPLPTPLPTNTPRPTSTPAPTAATSAAPTAETGIAWVNGIAELLDQKCTSCHGADSQLGGLDVSSYEAALAGGSSGPAVVPGEAHTSLLYTRQASGQHPGQFSPDELALIQQWIEAGAPEQPAQPGTGQPTSTAGAEGTGTPDASLPTVTPGVAGAATWLSDVAALMEAKCASCHSATVTLGGLDLSTYETALKGGVTGPGVVRGNPDGSQVAVRQLEGGHPGQFTPEELDLILAWIAAGAPQE